MTLLEKLEAATEGNRELDAEIHAHFLGGRPSHDFTEGTPAANLRKSYDKGTVFDHTDPETNAGNVLTSMTAKSEPVTTSIDAALALVERVLLGVEWEITNIYHVAQATIGLNFGEDQSPAYGRCESGSIPLAIMIALVKAEGSE